MESFGVGEGVPELTDEAEDRIETEGAQAFEFQMALDFAQCAEESGLRDGSEEYWARHTVEQIIDREAEIYAWQEDIEQYLANAQESLAG